MGNTNRHQQHPVTYHTPVTWTQSFPRDHRRLPKVSVQGNKVLPPPTATKLRPTENGRHLQVAGTISGRRGAELGCGGPQSLPGFVSSPHCLAHPHGPLLNLSTSLTHLHQPPPCALHNPSPLMSSHMRFGPPPSKVYASEPDLRSNGTPSLPPPSAAPHTIISQSPTKGRIKSKKRNRAPAPPSSGAHSDGGGIERGVHWGATDTAPSSRPPSQASRGPRRLGGGLFKKKNESRKSDNESSFTEDVLSGRPLYRRMEGSSTPRSQREEKSKRARSVDCLQHELRASEVSRERQAVCNRSTRRNGDGSSDDTNCERGGRRHSQTIEREVRRRSEGEDTIEQRLSITLERNRPKSPDNKTQLPDDKRRHYLNSPLKSRDSRYDKESLNRVFDEWEEAEKELIERRKISENMRNELQAAAKNLRKIGSVEVKRESEEKKTTPTKEEKEIPKTFFFGMEPTKEKSEEVRIEGGAVEYSRRDSSKLSNIKVSNDVEDFAVAIEKRKQQNVNHEENVSLRKEDGGYHSRQNSGSFHLENNDANVSVSLRPILPKRQREIPRFSPNAAWKFLGEEPFLSEENLNESRSSDDAVYEDKIRGYSRPIAPPRGSGEKSADSGISGDAGSPGPMPEFEPIKIVQSVDSGPWRNGSGGPLAVSSPVVSGDARRAWTPAQDLDDNSLDGSGEAANVPAPPASKLTTRTSMFDIFTNHTDSKSSMNNSGSAPPKLTSRTHMFSVIGGSSEPRIETDVVVNGTVEESTQTINTNIRKLRRSVSTGFNNISNNSTSINNNVINNDSNERRLSENDKWRDNWTMTRSINGESPPHIVTKSVIDSTNNTPVIRKLQSEAGTSLSSYPNQNGHIIYLPEYNSQLTSPGMVRSSSKTNVSSLSLLQGGVEGPEGGTLDSVNTSGSLNITSRDLNSSRHLKRNGIVMAPAVPRWGRKGKKFSYQSTVRVMEKRKIEEQLNREVEEKEQQRLQEIAAMKEVEEAFQKKREGEKKKLKQQLKLYQVMHRDGTDVDCYPSADSNVMNHWSDNGDVNCDDAMGSESPLSSVSSSSGRRNGRQAPDGAPSLNSPRHEVIVAARHRNGHLTTQELAEYHQPRREYREYRRSNRAVSASGGGVGDNYRRDFSRGNTQPATEDRVNGRHSVDGSYRPEVVDTASTCSSRSTSVVRVVNGKTTRYFEHPAATGNMAPAYKMEAYNKHVSSSHSKLLEA